MIDEEKKVKLVKAIVEDFKKQFKSELEELYNDETKTEDVANVCAKWHWYVITRIESKETKTILIQLIQIAYENGNNLDKDETWKRIIRCICNIESIAIKESEK